MSDFKFTAIKPVVVERLFEKALFALKEQALTDCNSLAKWDQGTMKDTARVEQDGMELTLIWDTPYAKAAYYTGRPSHSGTELQWAEKAKDRYGKEWIAILQKGMNE